MVRKSASLLVVLGCLAPGVVAALGLGELTLHSYLNEPLKAEVDLLETAELGADQIKIRLASREDFARAGVERQYFLTSLKFELEFSDDGSSRLLLTSTERVREPFLDFLIEARWPHGRILREYTVLLDPPLLSGSGSGVIATVSVPASEPVREPSATVGSDSAVPARADRYASNAAALPTAGAEYLVQRNETLWSIAARSKPTGTSIQQTMLDIQRLNRQAFIGNNINQLKAGYVLHLPSSTDISDEDFGRAVTEVAQQEANWQDNVATIDVRRPEADGDARRPEADGADGSGVVGADENQGRLQIAGVDGDIRDNGAGADLSARMENLDRIQRDNNDLLVRVGSMEEQVDTLKRLVALKDDQISALQSALAGSSDGTAVPDQQLGTIDSGTDEQPEPGLADGLINDLDELDTAPDVSQGPPTVEPAPGIAELAMDYLVYIVALLAILLAGVGWLLRDKLHLPRLSVPKLGIDKRGASQGQAGGAASVDDEFAGVVLVADDDLIVDECMDDATAGAVKIATLSSFSAPNEEAYAAQFETGDALAEADIYIAYGRFPQAVDVLKTAIAIEPINTEYRVKLMEACVEMVESEEFQQQFADLQLIDDDAALQCARALLDAVDGGEVWLENLPKPSLTADDIAAAKEALAVPEPAPEQDSEETTLPLAGEDTDEGGLELVDLDDYDLDASGGLDLQLDESTASDLQAGDDAGSLDLNLDIELEDLSEATDALILEEEAEQALEEITTRSDGEQSDEDVLAFGDLAVEESEDSPGTAAVDDDSDLSHFNMDNFQIEGDAPAAEPAAEESGGLAGADAIDLAALDLDELSAEDDDLKIESEPELEIAAEEDGGLLTDFGELEIDGGDEEEISFKLPEDETEEEGLMFASDGDEIATKLDLARAYLDMGDHESARSILEEVQQDGSENQQQEAQSLLDNID